MQKSTIFSFGLFCSLILSTFTIFACSSSPKITYDQALKDRLKGSLVLSAEWNKSGVTEYAYCDLKEKTIVPCSTRWFTTKDNQLFQIYRVTRTEGTYLKLVHFTDPQNTIEYNCLDNLKDSMTLVFNQEELYYNKLGVDHSLFKLDLKTQQEETINIPGNYRTVNLLGIYKKTLICTLSVIGDSASIITYDRTTGQISTLDKVHRVNYSNELGLLIYERILEGNKNLAVFDLNSGKRFVTNLSPHYSSYTDEKAAFCILSEGLLIYSIPRGMNLGRQLLTMSDYDPEKDYFVYDYLKSETLSKIDFSKPWVRFEAFLP